MFGSDPPLAQLPGDLGQLAECLCTARDLFGLSLRAGAAATEEFTGRRTGAGRSECVGPPRERMFDGGEEPLGAIEVADGSGDGTGIERGHICLLELFDDLRHRHVFILTRGSHRVAGSSGEASRNWIEFALHMHTGCGAAWLARLSGGQEVGSSNLPSPTL